MKKKVAFYIESMIVGGAEKVHNRFGESSGSQSI